MKHQMLYFGFLYDIEDILDETPGSKQTMLFSATMPKDIKNWRSVIWMSRK